MAINHKPIPHPEQQQQVEAPNVESLVLPSETVELENTWAPGKDISLIFCKIFRFCLEFVLVYVECTHFSSKNTMGTPIHERQADIINLNVGGTRYVSLVIGR